MLKPNANSDRLSYCNELLPPEGYTLKRAIGTTYSLDLEALTAVSMVLGLNEESESDMPENPVVLLEAFQKVSNKIVIFCENAQVKVPKKLSPLTLILEKMVVPVGLPKNKRTGRYAAFHPKMWLLEYTDRNENDYYRLIVLSRNLTFDRSWDICFSMDGVVSDDHDNSSAPIIDFLSFLKKKVHRDIPCAGEKRKMITQLEKRLGNVQFSINSREFDKVSVLPLGIGKPEYDINHSDLLTDSYHELVIMSPFLSNDFIAKFNEWGKELTDCRKALFTRKSELGKIKPEQAKRFKIYTLRDEVVDGESILSDENDLKQLQDIHAKMYMRRKNSHVDLYLGSMNATYSAANINVEMMVHLETKNRYLNYDLLISDLFCGKEDDAGNPFELSVVQPEEKDDVPNEEYRLEQLIKDICRIDKKATVTEVGERYDVEVIFSDIPEDIDCTISPLFSNKKNRLSEHMVFKDLDVLQLSEFYCIHLVGGDIELERIIMIPTVGIPEKRESAVVNSVIKDRRSFIEYIAFILEDDYLISLLQKEQLEQSGIFRQAPDVLPPIYEKMLKASLNNPEKLKEIEYVLKMITDETIIPDEFRETYEIFKKTLNIR